MRVHLVVSTGHLVVSTGHLLRYVALTLTVLSGELFEGKDGMLKSTMNIRPGRCHVAAP
jgi:hypothetical protein